MANNSLLAIGAKPRLSQSEDVRVMKKKIIIVIASVLLLLVGGAIILFYITFGDMIGQMREGKRYMNSLLPADRAGWINRTVALLNAHPVTNDLDVVWIYVNVRSIHLPECGRIS